MGDLLDPKPARWQRPTPQVEEDRVTDLATRLIAVLDAQIDNPVTQLAALRLVQKALTNIVAEANGFEAAKRTLTMASELAAHYEIKGIQDTED